MLLKCVNGVYVPMSRNEEAFTLNEWADAEAARIAEAARPKVARVSADEVFAALKTKGILSDSDIK